MVTQIENLDEAVQIDGSQNCLSVYLNLTFFGIADPLALFHREAIEVVGKLQRA